MSFDTVCNQKLFSYGTLRYESVQLATFGRILEGKPDSLDGFNLSIVKIKDQRVIQTSGEETHPIIAFTGEQSDQVAGIVFDISSEELERADSYEVADYKRINVQLRSGVNAWVYVSA